MSQAQDVLKPKLVGKYFDEILRLPRDSKAETEIVSYVIATAKKLGLSVKRDKEGNVAVKKPASTGSEDVRLMALQCHLEMPNVRTALSVAVATSLSLMEDRKLVHGPLEFLFTVAGKSGLSGANNLSPGFIKAKTLLNINSEDQNAIFVGCSGRVDTLATWKNHDESVEPGFLGVLLTVKGLKGGHSGVEIDKNHANAIKILNRVVMHFADIGARLASINGGTKQNAIPQEAHAIVYLPKKKMKDALEVLKEMRKVMREENALVEPDLKIEMEPLGKKKEHKVLKERLQSELCHTIAALPHGVIKMSSEMLGLVETSTNLAVVSTCKKKIVLGTSQRSSLQSELDDVHFAVSIVMKFGGAKVETNEGYPGWKPRWDSPVLKLAADTYRDMFSKDAEVKAVHAGLECSIVGNKLRGLDMISIGPTMIAAHTPAEEIDVASVERFYRFLVGLLAKH